MRETPRRLRHDDGRTARVLRERNGGSKSLRPAALVRVKPSLEDEHRRARETAQRNEAGMPRDGRSSETGDARIRNARRAIRACRRTSRGRFRARSRTPPRPASREVPHSSNRYSMMIASSSVSRIVPAPRSDIDESVHPVEGSRGGVPLANLEYHPDGAAGSSQLHDGAEYLVSETPPARRGNDGDAENMYLVVCYPRGGVAGEDPVLDENEIDRLIPESELRPEHSLCPRRNEARAFDLHHVRNVSRRHFSDRSLRHRAPPPRFRMLAVSGRRASGGRM